MALFLAEPLAHLDNAFITNEGFSVRAFSWVVAWLFAENELADLVVGTVH